MRAYHFVKYGERTSLDYLIAQTDNQTTLCFDFEDSIQDCLCPLNTAALKADYRNFFIGIIDRCKIDIAKFRIGIRINACDSLEYPLDISALAAIKNVCSIFIPKISHTEQILKLQHELERNEVSYQEIIPVVETKNGMNNLEEILKLNLNKIENLAFGHCDYNFDNANYPFFHQDSREYWTWITKLVELIKPKNLGLLNSPFLQLDNDEFFKKMLGILYAIGGNKMSQITLTQKQTSICNSFVQSPTNNLLPKILNRLDLRVPAGYAENFINSFEKNTNHKGFAINKDRIILSPQEYRSSLDYQRKIAFPEINFTFVGGCFPVQGNVPFENIFHQLLKKKIENIRDVRFNVNIIRYEHFRNCMSKIESYMENKPIDLLTFSIRPEPFLRLVKLYYKFLDISSGKKKWSLNLPAFNKADPEKYDLLSLYTRFNPTKVKDRSIIYKTLINLNYILGSLLGNTTYALRKYLNLVTEIEEYCRRNNIKLVILGPPIRTNTRIEKLLSKKLDKFMRKSLTISPNNYVSGSDLIKNGELLFKKNGIYANEKYHELIAERLLMKIVPAIDNLAVTNCAFLKMGQEHDYEERFI